VSFISTPGPQIEFADTRMHPPSVESSHLSGRQTFLGMLGARFDVITVFLGAFGLYMLSVVEVHTYDAIEYAISARTGLCELDRLLHPHHLVYNVVAHLYFQIWEFAGWTEGSIYPLQTLNIILSCTCLTVFYTLVSRLTKRDLAFGTTALLALSHGYWLYSVEVEVYIFSVLFLIATTYVLVFRCMHGLKYGVSAGILLGCAVLAHQTNVLFLPVVAAAAFGAPVSRAARFKQLWIFSTAFFLVVLIPYVIAVVLLKLFMCIRAGGVQSTSGILFVRFGGSKTWSSHMMIE
jgi:hypothetical protein